MDRNSLSLSKAPLLKSQQYLPDHSSILASNETENVDSAHLIIFDDESVRVVLDLGKFKPRLLVASAIVIFVGRITGYAWREGFDVDIHGHQQGRE